MPLERTTKPPLSNATDAAPVGDVGTLTRAMVRGEEQAYRAFHAVYFDRLSRYLTVAGDGDETRARDALQETFRRVAKNIRIFDREDVFWSWLTVLGRTALADERRKTGRYWRVLHRFSDYLAAQSQEPAPEPRPAAASRLEQSLDRLDANDRRLIELKYYARRPVREIAVEMGSTESAVESRLVRIRRRLKSIMVETKSDELA